MRLKNGLSLLAAVLITFFGCSKSIGDSLKMYFPNDEGMSWEYQKNIINADGHNSSKLTRKILKERQINNISVTPIMYNDGSKNIYLFTAYDKEGGYIYAFQSLGQEYPVVIKDITYFIKYPISKGTKWSSNGSTTTLKERVPMVINYEIESVEDTVTVPAGTYNNCLKITGIGSANKDMGPFGIAQVKKEHITWYAPNVGYIKESVKESSNNLMLGVDGKLFTELEVHKK